MLEEPTFGVDVGSKAEIYQILREALARGLAVLARHLLRFPARRCAGISHRACADYFDRGRVAAELAQRPNCPDCPSHRAGRVAERKTKFKRGWHEPPDCRAALPASGRARSTCFRFLGSRRILLVLLILVFSALKGDTFLTAFTFQSMANSRSINALVALAVMIPIASNNFDLSVASTLGISQVLANGLQTQQGLPWEVACLLCIVVGAIVGLITGLLVTRARINSFIATLGSQGRYSSASINGTPAAVRSSACFRGDFGGDRRQNSLHPGFRWRSFTLPGPS